MPDHGRKVLQQTSSVNCGKPRMQKEYFANFLSLGSRKSQYQGKNPLATGGCYKIACGPDCIEWRFVGAIVVIAL